MYMNISMRIVNQKLQQNKESPPKKRSKDLTYFPYKRIEDDGDNQVSEFKFLTADTFTDKE